MRGNCLYIVVPCFNEEAALPETARRLLYRLEELQGAGAVGTDSRIVFVDDGSKDATWKTVMELHRQDRRFLGLKLSRNRGQQNALLAGLLWAKDRADLVISIDADLQDDPEAMDEMVAKYHSGCDIVYGVRRERKTDSFFKRVSAEAFYRLMNLLGAQTVFNHADYRLMSRRALQGLSAFREVNLFLRGIVPMIGFPSDTVLYDRQERTAGETKYPLHKMLSFAWTGITSVSLRPIRVIAWLGVCVFLVSIAMLVYVLVSFFSGHVVPGWSSVTVSLWALGGLTLLSIGVVGEYIGKLYLEAKARPRYLIEEIADDREAGDAGEEKTECQTDE